MEYDSLRAFVAKLNQTTGEVLWYRVLPDLFSIIKGKIISDKLMITGTMLGVSGTYFIEMDLEGNIVDMVLQPTQSYGPGIFNPYFFFDDFGNFITFGYNIYKWELNIEPVWTFDFSRGLPNMVGQARTAISDAWGNIYATGNLKDTINNTFSTQTLKLSPDGELIWAKVNKFGEDTYFEGGLKISASDNHVFVCAGLSYGVSGNLTDDYQIALYSQTDGNILYDTIIDGNIRDFADYAHYGQNHFYLLGRSYVPLSTNPDDYRYKLFSFKVEEPSLATAEMGKMPSPAIFPNPSNGIFTLVQNEGVFYDQLTLYSLQGEMIISQKITSKKQVWNLPELLPGVYMVKFSGHGRELYEKLVIAGRP
ncbi:MAG: T9SS type A sorting domain-containing protein [Lewinellaceae bacterium]|nr:T9SS type A sorting domain-containing protein [Saprospiraceae bacterium]MCB9336603.1 T9SS type A sorting domain-containing protein [Lewinellaceae bacterium]